jgi:hypothetical protein
MQSRRDQQPIAIRLPAEFREWLLRYAADRKRPLTSVVIEALEEYRAKHDQQGDDGMRVLPPEHAKHCLHGIFAHNFLQPDKPAWYPIQFPGLEYREDHTLADGMKDKATRHLLAALSEQGLTISSADPADATSALHHVLWDKWTKQEIGNGRFTGQLFDDHGLIYRGYTAWDAASRTIERLTALGGSLCSTVVGV